MNQYRIVNPAEAIEVIRGYARANRIETLRHARRRMRERNVSHADLRQALSLAVGCTPQQGERWRVSGPDVDGNELVVVVELDDGDIVVTLF